MVDWDAELWPMQRTEVRQEAAGPNPFHLRHSCSHDSEHLLMTYPYLLRIDLLCFRDGHHRWQMADVANVAVLRTSVTGWLRG